MIGVLGGTFDPIHYGHLRPAHEVQRALGLEQIRFVPAGVPPHRAAPAATAEQRLRMVERAVAQYPAFAVDDREVRRAGPAYTVDTLESMRAQRSGDVLCLIVGIDAFLELDSWHRWRRISDLAHIVVMQRPGWPKLPEKGGALFEWSEQRRVPDSDALRRFQLGRILFQTVTLQDISASQIRSAVARGESVQASIPPAVWDYIRTHRLYGCRGA